MIRIAISDVNRAVYAAAWDGATQRSKPFRRTLPHTAPHSMQIMKSLHLNYLANHTLPNAIVYIVDFASSSSIQ